MIDRNTYVETLKAQLEQWNAQIDLLEARAKAARAEGQKAFEEQVGVLRSQRDTLNDRLRDLRQASEDAWGDLQGGVDQAFDSFRQSVKQAMSRFE